MKLEATTFYAAFHDGLLEMQGHEFDARGRVWVVHKRRPPYDEFKPGYVVSDKETGFGFFVESIPDIRNRQEAVQWAINELENYTEQKLDSCIRHAKAIRNELEVIRP